MLITPFNSIIRWIEELNFILIHSESYCSRITYKINYLLKGHFHL